LLRKQRKNLGCYVILPHPVQQFYGPLSGTTQASSAGTRRNVHPIARITLHYITLH